MEKGGADSNNFGVASFVFGVLSAVFSILLLPSFIFGMLGVVFGCVQIKRKSNGWPVWGIVLSVLGMIVSILLIWKIVVVFQGVQQQIQLCASNPSLPGCEGIASLMAQTAGQ
jgi:uncharacterized membrane protein YsdA (DUF1294 family)